MTPTEKADEQEALQDQIKMDDLDEDMEFHTPLELQTFLDKQAEDLIEARELLKEAKFELRQLATLAKFLEDKLGCKHFQVIENARALSDRIERYLEG